MVEGMSITMEKSSPTKTLMRKRKKKTVAPVKTKSSKLEDPSPELLKHNKHSEEVKTTEFSQAALDELSKEDIKKRFPVLKDEQLVQRFLSVPLTNNQKGRIRLVLKDNLKGTSKSVLPDVIHTRIQAVLKSSTDLTDADLRKIRILYNMLKTAVAAEKVVKKEKGNKKIAENGDEIKEKTVKAKKKDSDKEVEKSDMKEPKEKKEQAVQKIKGMKRYVVFLGNLPLGIDEEKIKSHFSELSDHIVSIRIPQRKPDSKSAIAYLELKNEPTYELALSKHHSMLGSKRINVLYTTQQKTKISKTEAKSKTAKLVALQKSGALIGSTPLAKKRSQRRKKLKKARAAEAENA